MTCVMVSRDKFLLNIVTYIMACIITIIIIIAMIQCHEYHEGHGPIWIWG